MVLIGMFRSATTATTVFHGLEAPAECPVVQEFGGQDLERDGPIQPGVVCFVDGAHSAPAEQAADDELPQRRPCGQHVHCVAVGNGAD